MFALFSFAPKFCSACGRETKLENPLVRNDYERQCSFSCACGLRYQYIRRYERLIQLAADEGGDLAEF
jgi:hypothetical protein